VTLQHTESWKSDFNNFQIEFELVDNSSWTLFILKLDIWIKKYLQIR